MLKLFTVLFNLITFIVVTALLPADIKIETMLPDRFVVDSTYVIEVKITKGSIFGFAKYQQNLPIGFTAEAVSTADGSFTFADGKVKFIWMALPENEEITISYAVKATSEAPAEGMFEGKFSYIEDNERKSYDIPNIPVKVTTESPVKARVLADASVDRVVTDLGGNEYEVALKIKKTGVEGFAKVEEFLPAGSTATVKSNNKAVFSQVDDKAKFVWMAIPDMNEFEVSYTVKGSSDILNALAAMEGGFSYLDQNETKTTAIKGQQIVAAQPAVATIIPEPKPAAVEPKPEVTVVEPTKEIAVVTPTPQPEPTPVAQPEPVKEVAPKQEVASSDVPKTQPKAPVTEVEKAVKPTPAAPAKTMAQSAIPKPESGVTYKVQIVAGHKQVSEKYIQEHFKFNESFGVENHDGWIKYTTGGYPAYQSARDKRMALVEGQHNFPGPFVTAYNSGQRITVQEALMISNQKWVK